MSNNGRWNRKVQFTWKNQLREPYPPDFKFVYKESELVNDPLCSGKKVDQRTEKEEKERTQLEEESKEKGCCKDTNDVVTCVMWAKNHDLEQCLKQFKVHLPMFAPLLGLIVYRNWKQQNSLGVTLVTLMLIKQSLVSVFWGT